MAQSTWSWATLSGEQSRMLAESERALGADYLLAYQPPTTPSSAPIEAPIAHLQPAPLTDSQLECLQGLEVQLQAIVVAYRESDQRTEDDPRSEGQ
ncbi:MAG: hypothetical protein NVS4B8_17200 [Herpetosiphon sp.]